MQQEDIMAPPAKAGSTAKPAAKKETGGQKKAGPDLTLRRVGAVGDPIPDNPPRSRRVNYDAVLENLAAAIEEPGQVFEIVHYAARLGSAKNPGSALKLVDKLTSGEIELPEGPAGNSFIVEARHAGYDGTDREGSVVLAVWAPDEEE